MSTQETPLGEILAEKKGEEMNNYKLKEELRATIDPQRINYLSQFIFFKNKSVGWWPDDISERNAGECIALMHSELSEALEGLRKNKMDDHLPERKSVEVELADTVIRILDFCGAHDLDLGGAIFDKIIYNAQRADHKLENRQKEDGKKF